MFSKKDFSGRCNEDEVESETLLDKNNCRQYFKTAKNKAQTHSVFIFIFVILLSYSILIILVPSSVFTNYEKSHKSDENRTKIKDLNKIDSASVLEKGTVDKPSKVKLKASCVVPRLDPFSKVSRDLITEPPKRDCSDENGYPLLFSSTLNSTLVSIPEFRKRISSVDKCCYQYLIRSNSNVTHPDEGFNLSKKCFPVDIDNNLVTVIPPGHEFIVVSCNTPNNTDTPQEEVMQVFLDIHAFVHEKPKVEKRVQAYYAEMESLKLEEESNSNSEEKQEETVLLEEDKLNVIILGIDSVSHMNFIRFMPETYAYLKTLSAVEMQALNKPADNTLPVMSTALTGKYLSELESSCTTKGKTFDDCPLIWKKYASSGYRTCFGEDSTWIGIFNWLKRGFIKPPTDYYLRPLGLSGERLVHHKIFTKKCYGPRLSFEVLLDYMRKFAFKMGHDKRYFQLIWTCALTHDIFNFARLGDKKLLETLKWFQEEGFLNHTAFILMSDHGMRWGDFQQHLQGQLEDRLPFLFYLLPEWFKEKYSRAFKNLLRNRELLTSHFDLYEVLLDLNNLTRLNPSMIKERERGLEESLKNGSLPRAISQFLPIPLSRTCKQAGISDHFCTCHRLVEVGEADKNKPEVQQVANFIVEQINRKIRSFNECAHFTVKEIQVAYRIESNDPEFQNGKMKAYRLTVVTSPKGIFHSSVKRNVSDEDSKWKLAGVITRADEYGPYSYCMEEKWAKIYCVCKGAERGKTYKIANARSYIKLTEG